MKRALIPFFILLGCCLSAFSQGKKDSILYRNSIKLDLIPFYHVFFDNRVQIRVGMEYERVLSKRSSASCYLDIGLYDKYDFIKYYDFFSQSTGIYSVQQKVSIIGFHLLPSYNYCFFQFKHAPEERLFISLIADVGQYHKKADHYNTLTLERSSSAYNQTKLGAGLGLGFKNHYGPRFILELKTSLIFKLYNHLSDKSQNSIKSLDAQWTSPNYKLWWVSNIKIGYAF